MVYLWSSIFERGCRELKLYNPGLIFIMLEDWHSAVLTYKFLCIFQIYFTWCILSHKTYASLGDLNVGIGAATAETSTKRKPGFAPSYALSASYKILANCWHFLISVNVLEPLSRYDTTFLLWLHSIINNYSNWSIHQIASWISCQFLQCLKVSYLNCSLCVQDFWSFVQHSCYLNLTLSIYHFAFPLSSGDWSCN